MIEITYLVFFIFIILLFYYIISKISVRMIFTPQIISNDMYQNLLNNKNFRHIKIQTGDKEILDAGLYNHYRRPKYSDTIFLYSYGNAGWSGWTINSSTIQMLSKFGSIFLYDYRGYGKSTGSVHESGEEGIFEDIRSVWSYLTKTKNVNPNKIILFGNSVGTAISTYFLNELVNNKKELPKCMVLQNPFFNIKDISCEITPFVGNFVVSNLYTNNYLSNIDKKTKNYEIIILHSEDDELIGNHHGHKLSKIVKNNKCKFVNINGSHNDPIYNNLSDSIIRKICSE